MDLLATIVSRPARQISVSARPPSAPVIPESKKNERKILHPAIDKKATTLATVTALKKDVASPGPPALPAALAFSIPKKKSASTSQVARPPSEAVSAAVPSGGPSKVPVTRTPVPTASAARNTSLGRPAPRPAAPRPTPQSRPQSVGLLPSASTARSATSSNKSLVSANAPPNASSSGVPRLAGRPGNPLSLKPGIASRPPNSMGRPSHPFPGASRMASGLMGGKLGKASPMPRPPGGASGGLRPPGPRPSQDLGGGDSKAARPKMPAGPRPRARLVGGVPQPSRGPPGGVPGVPASANALPKGLGRAPMPPTGRPYHGGPYGARKMPCPPRFNEDPYGLDEYDEGDLDFIDDDPIETPVAKGVDWRAALRGITGYDPRAYVGRNEGEAAESSLGRLQEEEMRSARIAAEEDAEELKKIEMEEAEERRRKARKLSVPSR